MSLLPIVFSVVDAGLAVAERVEAWQAKRRARRIAERRAREQWAQTRATIRACPRCHEIAYTPGQVACSKCGALL